MRRSLVMLITVGLLVGIGWWLYSAPVFRSIELAITGLETLGEADIYNHLNITRDKHLFELMMDQPQALLLKHPRIGSATVQVQLPARLMISIKERRPIALLPYHGNFLCIDNEGKVTQLLTGSTQSSDLPLMIGLRLPIITVGDQLPNSPNLQAGLRVLSQLGILYQKQLAEIDVSSAMQVMLRSQDNVLIDVGEGLELAGKSAQLLDALSYVRQNNLHNGIILVGKEIITYCAPEPGNVTDSVYASNSQVTNIQQNDITGDVSDNIAAEDWDLSNHEPNALDYEDADGDSYDYDDDNVYDDQYAEEDYYDYDEYEDVEYYGDNEYTDADEGWEDDEDDYTDAEEQDEIIYVIDP